MKRPKLVERMVAAWQLEDGLSRSVVLASLLLVIWAYLPTLQFDYVTQDQWRAFRYSTEPTSARDRAEACIHMLPTFYTLLGVLLYG